MGTTEVFARLDELLAGVARRGVVHVGAHHGQEVPAYRAAGFERIVLVEPNPAHWAALASLGDDVVLHRCAAGPRGRATLHVTRYDTESSLLRPLQKRVCRTVDVDVVPLADLQAGCNVAVVDVQGGELDVLRTAALESLDAAIVECEVVPRYAGGARRDEIEAFFAAADGWELAGVFEHRTPELHDIAWRRT